MTNYVLELIIVVIEIISFVNISECFFLKKADKGRVHNIISLVIFTLMLIINLNLFSSSIVPKTLFLLIIPCVFLEFCYKGAFYKKAIAPIFFVAFVNSIDFAVVFGICAWWGISQEQAVQSPVFFIFGAIISRFTLFLLTYLAKRLHLKHTHQTINNPKDWALILVFLLSALMNLYLLFEISIYAESLDSAVFISTVGIVFTTIGIFEITLNLEKQKQKELDSKVLQNQIKLEMQKVSSTMELYKNQRKLTHDFKKHLNVLGTLISINDFEKAKKYIDDLLKKQEKSSLVVYSNNPIIDALLTQKYIEAKNNKVRMDIMVDDLTDFPIKDTDVVIILANLLDNAIEASKCSKGDKYISVIINLTEKQNVLKVKNTTSHDIKIENGVIITTKENKVEHGFGISSVKDIFDKYAWNYMINVENNVFEFIAIQLK